jgi:glycosyltransferase involved in cell wall biosynthesis
MLITIDVVIPSYRLNEKFLLPILELDIPDDCSLNFILIADNPSIKIPESLNPYIDRGVLSIFTNETNLGAHTSRNVGINKSKSEWILFLDDDIVPDNNLIFAYVEAIQKVGEDVPGFVGLTEYPAPQTTFTKGVLSSDILTFFTLSRYYDEMAWGVTANILIKREAIKDIRFSASFPKKGGGEDIDFCLNIISGYSRRFVCLPSAKVTHPWWESKESAYKRFFRWAYGDSLLPNKHSKHRYYNLPNVIEFTFIALLFGIAGYAMNLHIPFLPIVCGIVVGEFFGEWLKLGILKKEYSVSRSFVSMTIRASNDMGRLVGNISRKRINGLFERFDYFCDGKHIKHEKKWALIKFVMSSFFIVVFLGIYKILIGF